METRFQEGEMRPVRILWVVVATFSFMVAVGVCASALNPQEHPVRDHPNEGAQEQGNHDSEPWSRSQIQEPANLAKELSDAKSKKPLIVCVGFEFLYRNAHIPGALFLGPAAKSDGLENLKRWAQNVSRRERIVLYCGCCPWKQCPNIRPAFKLLREMGFTRLKVLRLEKDFASAWVEKGFPVEKGK